MNKPHKCHIDGCEAAFNRPGKLEIHLRKHTGERPFTCNECDKKYSNESHLRRHKNTFHSLKPANSVQCTHKGCYRLLANSTNLKKHINRNHSQEHRYEHSCAMCNKSFRKKHQLSAHLFQHTGLPQFICESCNVGFVTLTQYNKHKSNHKTYVCKCSSKFDRWSKLLKHRKLCIEYLQKQECEQCGKKFISKLNLKKHKETHEGTETIYECPIEDCENIYKYERNLTYHIKKFHLKQEGKKLKCPYPGCTMILSKQNLDNHLKYHNNEKTKKKNFRRKQRKDKGTIKKSTALYMTGLSMPFEAEKMVLRGQKFELYMEDIKQSDFSEDDSYSSEDSNESDSDEKIYELDDSEDVTDIEIEISNDEESDENEKKPDIELPSHDLEDVHNKVETICRTQLNKNDIIIGSEITSESIGIMDLVKDNIEKSFKENKNVKENIYTHNQTNTQLETDTTLNKNSTNKRKSEEDISVSSGVYSNKTQNKEQADADFITDSDSELNIIYENSSCDSEEELKAIAETLDSGSEEESNKTVNNENIEDLYVDSRKRNLEVDADTDFNKKRISTNNSYTNQFKNLNEEIDSKNSYEENTNTSLNENAQVSNIVESSNEEKNMSVYDFISTKKYSSNVFQVPLLSEKAKLIYKQKCSNINLQNYEEHKNNTDISEGIKSVLKVFIQRFKHKIDNLEENGSTEKFQSKLSP